MVSSVYQVLILIALIAAVLWNGDYSVARARLDLNDSPVDIDQSDP